ncbi:MAG: nucleotide exchange factor GrpE [Pseudonocardiaceae bacterium]|nr:MAG: nucleotide exchange factor GrpE [Pseudonocardiaceae bacterium]
MPKSLHPVRRAVAVLVTAAAFGLVASCGGGGDAVTPATASAQAQQQGVPLQGANPGPQEGSRLAGAPERPQITAQTIPPEGPLAGRPQMPGEPAVTETGLSRGVLPQQPAEPTGVRSPVATIGGEPEPTAAESGSGLGRLWIVLGAVVLAALAFLVGRMSAPRQGAHVPGPPPARAPHGPEPGTGPIPVTAPVPPPAGPPPRPGTREIALVDGVIGAHDLAADEAQQRHLEQVLRRTGIVPVVPATGSPLDHAEVVGTAPATSSDEVGTVADVVRYGWADGGAIIRPAQVIVYVEAAE